MDVHRATTSRLPEIPTAAFVDWDTLGAAAAIGVEEEDVGVGAVEDVGSLADVLVVMMESDEVDVNAGVLPVEGNGNVTSTPVFAGVGFGVEENIAPVEGNGTSVPY